MRTVRPSAWSCSAQSVCVSTGAPQQCHPPTCKRRAAQQTLLLAREERQRDLVVEADLLRVDGLRDGEELA